MSILPKAKPLSLTWRRLGAWADCLSVLARVFPQFLGDVRVTRYVLPCSPGTKTEERRLWEPDPWR